MELFARLIEPRQSIDKSKLLFTNSDLKKLIIPLVIEQLLVMMVGLVDSMMVSQIGEAAVSGVSLVDMLNGLIIFIFSALATGGAVVVSQYIGSKNEENTNTAAGQLIMVATVISLVLTLLILIFYQPILMLFFGKVEADVMAASKTYLLISLFSFPFLAIYSACAALFRSMSKSKVTMNISVVMNVLNVIGNSIGIFVLHAGVAGVAYPTLISRAISAIAMLVLLHNKKNMISIQIKQLFKWKIEFVTKILKVAVPNGIENGLFQLSKLVLVGIIATFGTSQIAANGIANNIDYIGAVIVMALGLAVVTVVGQCIGANDYEQATYYIRKFIRIAYATSIILDLAIIALLPLILKLYALSPETIRYVVILVVLHNVFIMTIYPYSGTLSSAMRAAGDVHYTMSVSIFATVFCRVALSMVFGVWLGMGIMGVWIAMGLDWGIRALLFVRRFRNGKWKQFRVI